MIYRKVFSALLIICTLFFSCFSLFVNTPKADALVNDWQKGVSMYPMSQDDFGSDTFKQSLSHAHAAGANTVALIVPMYQSDIYARDIFAGWNTPTDAALIAGANYAHSLGMKVVFKLHVDPLDGQWRALINTWDRDTWFKEYGDILNHLGDVATQTGSEGMVVGTELITMATNTSNSDNTQRWNTLINNVRTHFSGYLTYSANWGGSDFAEEAPHIGFWSNLDYIGLSAYYPLAGGQGSPSVDALTGSWGYWDTNKIRVLHDQYNKPILFTEIGYRSYDGAHNAPWDSWSGGTYNPTEQVNDFQALLSYWNNIPYMNGIYVWNWDTNPNAGGAGNTDYTIQNKPAQDTLASWFGTNTNPNPGNTGGGTGGTSSASAVDGTWSMSATVPALTVGQAATVGLDVGISGSATNVIVDAEIYNANGQQVVQKVFTGQNIASQSAHYNIDWTPTNNEAYTLKVGIFNTDWTTLYIWNDAVSVMNVGGSSPSGGDTGGGIGSPEAILDIWWPSDGAAVSGVQPFKAMLEGRAISTYTMYWQVDGGELVHMRDDLTDYPHKEFDVDLDPWTWSGSGPYTITFVAKDSQGNVIAQKSVSIMVAH